MSSSNDSDPFDTLSLAETDGLSDFELVDVEQDDVRFFAPSSTGSDAASNASDVESTPPSPQMDASRFHFPDPASVFQDEQRSLESSSMYTLLASSQHDDPSGAPELNASDEVQETTQHTEHAAPPLDLGRIEKMDFLHEPEHEQDQASPWRPHRRLATMAPKAVWLIALFATVVLGFKSTTLLGLPHNLSTWHHGRMAHNDWTTKFASPSHHSSVSSAVASSSQTAPSLALAPKPSPSGLTVKKAEAASHGSERPSTPSRFRSVALQKSITTSKGLSIVRQSSACPSRLRDAIRCSGLRDKSARTMRYAALAGQRAFSIHPDLPVFPSLPASSFLDNATTTTWAFWLAELDNVFQLSLQPAISAAREQANEAVRLVQRYHQEQVRPAFACVREHAFQTAQRTAEFTSQYSEAQVRPAFAFVRDHAAQAAHRTAKYHENVVMPAFVHFGRQAAGAARSTSEELHKAAKRTAKKTSQYNKEQLQPAFASFYQHAAETAQHTAEYHAKVIVPALAQFRLQAVDAAKTTSEGLNKAAKRFSSEARPAVQQVKEATYVNLEALGVDEYLGFVMTTFKSIKHNLHSAEQAT